MKLCSECGRANTEDALFCAYCAAPFDQALPGGSSLQDRPASEDPLPNAKPLRRLSRSRRRMEEQNGLQASDIPDPSRASQFLEPEKNQEADRTEPFEETEETEEKELQLQEVPAEPVPTDSSIPFYFSPQPKEEENASQKNVVIPSEDSSAQEESNSARPLTIGFIQPEIVSASSFETDPSFQKPAGSETDLPENPRIPGGPPSFDPSRFAQEQLSPSHQPKEDQKKWLSLAAAAFGVLALGLAGLLLYQSTSSSLLAPALPMQEMEEVFEEEIPSLEKSESRTGFYFRSSRSSESSSRKKTDQDPDSQKEASASSQKPSANPAQSSESASLEGSLTKFSQPEEYLTNFVMNIRQEPSTSSSQVAQAQAGEIVTIDQTRTFEEEMMVWGHLSDNSGWICIQDSEQEYLTAVNRESSQDTE